MIEVEALTRVYGGHKASKPAVDGISFKVSRGEVLGLLGPNGAGKSTTMKMLTCFLPPTSGRASIAGFDVFDKPLQVRERIGYLPEETPLYGDMTVIGYLRFVARVRGLQRSERDARIKQIGKTTGILDVLGKYVNELSRGYRQRVGLTQALLHDPPVLILDEPTSGLDPNQIVEIRELIRDIGEQKTVILSTHILPEVQATCNRVLIINEGVIVADGAPDELVGRESKSKHRLLLAGDAGPGEDEVVDAVKALEGVAKVSAVSVDGNLELSIDGEIDVDLRLALSRLAASKQWPLLELERREASLEEVFGRLTRSDEERAS